MSEENQNGQGCKVVRESKKSYEFWKTPLSPEGPDCEGMRERAKKRTSSGGWGWVSSVSSLGWLGMAEDWEERRTMAGNARGELAIDGQGCEGMGWR